MFWYGNESDFARYSCNKVLSVILVILVSPESLHVINNDVQNEYAISTFGIDGDFARYSCNIKYSESQYLGPAEEAVPAAQEARAATDDSVATDNSAPATEPTGMFSSEVPCNIGE